MGGIVPELDEVIATAELGRRPRRDPDYRAENEALSALARVMATAPDQIFKHLVDTALRLCRAHSAGVSLLDREQEQAVFRWRATAGAFAPLVGSTLPRNFSPCGVVLDRDGLQLMIAPARYYPYIADLSDPVHEVLLVPFYHGGEAVGTLWVVAHDERRLFDAEDARVATSLSQFASAAWQAMQTRAEMAATQQALQTREREQERSLVELAAIRELAKLMEARFEAFFDQAPFYAGILSREGVLDDVSRMALQACGYTREEVTGKRFWETSWWHGCADAQEKLRAGFAEALQGGTFKSVLPYHFADGSERIAEVGLSPVYDEHGEVNFVMAIGTDITERKRGEQERERIANELRRLTAVHETVLSATNDFAYIFDRQGRVLYANRPLLTVWAKTLDEVVGKTWHELGYPTWHADMHLREIAQVIATGQPVRGEVPFTGASGISGIYDYIFAPVFGADGEVELIAGTTRDVTERRRSEDRDRFLVALDDASRPLTDASKITQACARLLGEHLQANRCAYADVEADENTFNLTGDYNRGVPSIVGRYRFDQFGDECLRLMRAGEPYVVEDVQRDPRTAGARDAYEATHIRSVVCVPLHKAGQFVAAMAVHRTAPRAWQEHEIELVQLVANRCWESIERTRVMRVLAESEQQLRLAVETARLGVWDLDLETEVMTCSPQCKANYGQPADQPFTSADFWRIIHPEDRERVRTAMGRATAACRDYELEHQTLGPDGHVQWVLVRGHLICTGDGKPQRIVGVTLDITARKQAERELAQLHEEAVRASRAKDDFLAALSHELRTPLNPVLLLASESANDPELSPQARHSFEIIRRNVELEARLIDDLLDLTSIARGKIVVRKQPVAVHDTLQEAAAAMRGDFDAKDITLELQLDAPGPFVHGDSVRLLQIFLNLLKNAVKFTPVGGRVIVTTGVPEAGLLEVRVADTGIGMTGAELERAFAAFEQGDHAVASGSHRFGGLGLGLAIARQLVELHGGTIQAFSAGRDQGATFAVRLPLVVAPVGTEVPEGAEPRSEAKPGRTGLHVLLVEDHEPTRGALNHLLQRRAYRVTCTGSVAEARACAERETFDFVISDIGLPDGDGAALMAELRDRFGLRGIALTGYGMEQDIARCHAAGFTSHLPKPVRVESLEAALAELSEVV